MKTRESGMPEKERWENFFSPRQILEALKLAPDFQQVVDFGCGYGTFSIPAAEVIRGSVYAFDVEADMIAETRRRAEELNLANVHPIQRDFVVEGTGLADQSVDYAMLFNILHAEESDALAQETFRILRPGGILGVVHWRCDTSTPRGPSMAIRPRPEQCVECCRRAGFSVAADAVTQFPPYHYGFAAMRPNE